MRNITELNMAAHKFDGFNVRVIRRKWLFQKYVPCSLSSRPGARRAAVKLRDELIHELSCSTNWHGAAPHRHFLKMLANWGVTVTSPLGMIAE